MKSPTTGREHTENCGVSTKNGGNSVWNRVFSFCLVAHVNEVLMAKWRLDRFLFLIFKFQYISNCKDPRHSMYGIFTYIYHKN